MANAIKAVRSGEMELKKHRRCSKCRNRHSRIELTSRKRIEKPINTRLGRKPVLPYNLEEELLSYSLTIGRKFFGLNTRSIKRVDFELAIKIGLAFPLSVQHGRADWKCLRIFMCHNPRLRLRKPKVTSAARVKRFAKIKVLKFSTYWSQCCG